MKRIIRRIIRYVNLFFAILLVLSFLSPGISPERFAFPSFLGLAYPYILFINLILMIFWISYKKREFIISFLAILLGWNTFTRYFSLHPGSLLRKARYESIGRDEREEKQQLKVMSYNVRAFNLYQWTDIPRARENIISLFRENNPDIICFQEYYSTRRGAYNAEEVFRSLSETPYKYIYAPLGRRNYEYGLAIFSHYPIVSSGSIKLNTPISMCSYSDLDVFGDTIRVYNMHLQSIRLNSQHYRFIDSLKFRYDNQQMEEILDISSRLREAFVKRASQADAITAHIARCPYPVIVCGDFNDTPVSYAYRTLIQGLHDAFNEAGWGVGRTYNGKFPSFRIDFILIGGTFEAVQFTRNKVRLSDHFPVTAFLEKKESHDPVEQIRGWVKKD